MKRICANYCGDCCVNGCYKYIDEGITKYKILRCADCIHYKGCNDCIFYGTDFCEETPKTVIDTIKEEYDKLLDEMVNDINDLYGCDPMYYNVDAFIIADGLLKKGYRKENK